MALYAETVPDSVERTFLIVDDRHLLREALEALIRKEWPNSRIIGFDIADEVVDFAASESADVVLLNFDAGVMRSIEAIRFVRTSQPATKVLVLQFEGTIEEELELFRAGVGACVPKKVSGASIVEILRLVTAGGAYISADVAALLARHEETMLQNSTSIKRSLSAREYTLLGFLKLGSSNKEIARRLRISESAVKLYLRNLFHKLGVRNRTEAVITGIRAGIFESGGRQPVQQIRRPIAEGTDLADHFDKYRDMP